MTTYDGAKVIGLAQNEINTLRGPHEDNEFGRELGLNNVFWCSVFVSAMMKRAGFTSLYPVTASTRISYAFYRKQHWIVPKMDGRPGDIAWMFFPGRIGPVNHIGLVTGVHGDGSVSVIDGNSGGPAGIDGVFRHKYRNAVVALGRPGGRGPVDVPGPPPFPGRPLTSGDRGEDVKVVQRNRLVPAESLGTVGVGTWSMLAAPVFTETLAQGSNGKAVQQLKQALNKFGNDLTVTNPSFGPETRHVVETWQKHRGQRADGRVDMPTWYWMHIAMPADQIHVPNLHP